MDIQKTLKSLPDSPSVYIFKDKNNKVLYVGKASSLKKRVRSYFKAGYGDVKRKILVSKIEKIDYILAESEAEALLYEAQLIKEYQPKYNVVFKDDKAYPLLKLTLNEKYPRLCVVRRKRNDDALYFGPYADVGLLRQALKFLRKIFPLRSCKRIPKDPCLYYHLGLCFAPCTAKVDSQSYNEVVKDLILFLSGKHNKLIERLTRRMDQMSKRQEFEKAALIRDQIKAFSKLISKEPIIESADYVRDLQKVLILKGTPHNIDAFDVSNIFGYQSGGAVVRFRDGQPDKNYYRRFKIKITDRIDDYQMMKEIVQRRYRHLKQMKENLPDLIVIDGGRGHLNSACGVLKEMGLCIPIIGIAKEKELIYLPDREKPLKLSPNSKTLHFVQRVRDEAHRFALSYHHILRKRLTKESILKEIQDIGPKRYKNLIKEFGSIDKIKNAGLKDLVKVELIDEKIARNIIEYFKKIHSI